MLYGELERASGFKRDIFWIDSTKDLLRFFTSRKAEGYSLKEYIRPYLRKKVFAIWQLTDPLPYLKRLFYPLMLAGKKLTRPFKK